MTDPLTGKELVERSYEYINKLTKECSKSLLEEFAKTHKRFAEYNLPGELGANVVSWFQKRDKNIFLSFDQSYVSRPNASQAHLRFKGNTKDADFNFTASVGTFSIPGAEQQQEGGSGNSVCFVKTLAISVDKANFARRKT